MQILNCVKVSKIIYTNLTNQSNLKYMINQGNLFYNQELSPAKNY